MEPKLKEDVPNVDELTRIALAYRGASDEPCVALDRIQREYNRLARLILRLEKRLADVKAARPPDRPPAGPEKETCTNEPEPIRTPSESALILVHSRPSPPPQTLTPTTARPSPGERGRRLHSA